MEQIKTRKRENLPYGENSVTGNAIDVVVLEKYHSWLKFSVKSIEEAVELDKAFTDIEATIWYGIKPEK